MTRKQVGATLSSTPNVAAPPGCLQLGRRPQGIGYAPQAPTPASHPRLLRAAIDFRFMVDGSMPLPKRVVQYAVNRPIASQRYVLGSSTQPSAV